MTSWILICAAALVVLTITAMGLRRRRKVVLPSVDSEPFRFGETLPGKDRTDERILLLEPNRYSKEKIECYAVGLEWVIKLGEPCTIMGRGSPDVNFRVRSFSANVPCPSFVRVTDFRVANVTGICVGGSHGGAPQKSEAQRDTEQLAQAKKRKVIWCENGGALDLWHFRSARWLVDLPTLTPANSFYFDGEYDGFIPDGYKEGDEFRLSIMLAGPASIVA